MAVTVKKAILWRREVDNQPGMLANTCRSAPASESGWRGCRVRARTTGRLQNPRDVLGGSDELRKLRHAVDKAHGDRDQAIRNVCRLHGVRTLHALPGADPGRDVGAARRLRVSMR
jgi:hypothetical protein